MYIILSRGKGRSCSGCHRGYICGYICIFIYLDKTYTMYIKYRVIYIYNSLFLKQNYYDGLSTSSLAFLHDVSCLWCLEHQLSVDNCTLLELYIGLPFIDFDYIAFCVVIRFDRLTSSHVQHIWCNYSVAFVCTPLCPHQVLLYHFLKSTA